MTDCDIFVEYSILNNVNKVKELLSEPRSLIGDDCFEALRYACSNNHDQIVQLILEDGRINPSKYNNVCLNYAVVNNNSKIIKLLLEANKNNLKFNGYDICKHAIFTNSIDALKILLEYNIGISDDIVAYAADYSNIDAIEVLLAHNNVKLDTDLAASILEKAIKFKETSVINLILSDKRGLKGAFKLKQRYFNILKDKISDITNISYEELDSLRAVL